jgi:hypothetical protein
MAKTCFTFYYNTTLLTGFSRKENFLNPVKYDNHQTNYTLQSEDVYFKYKIHNSGPTQETVSNEKSTSSTQPCKRKKFTFNPSKTKLV